MSTAEVFDVGGHQAVRLPEEIHFDGRVVSVRREGKAVILEPVAASESPTESWPEGFFDAVHIDDPKFVRPEQGALTSNSAAESDDAEFVYISPRAYLRSMLAIAWSCFRHPFSTTRIDLATGEVIPLESKV
jgi:antitoxin VapB